MLLPESLSIDWGDDADCRAGVSVAIAFAFGIRGKIGVVVFQLLIDVSQETGSFGSFG